MDRKILNLIIITLSVSIITAGLVVYRLVDLRNEKETEKTAPSVTQETKEEKIVYTEIDDPVGEDGYKVHTSENGYTVKYPADLQAKSMAKSVDFVLDDVESGSSMNIVTAANDGTLKKMTKEEFEHSLLHTSGDSVLLSYKDVNINGVEAVEAVFTYLGNETKQTVIITENYGYNITVSKSQYISEEMSAVFDGIVSSFKLN